MRNQVLKTAIISSLLTALAVSTITLYAGPRLLSRTSPMDDAGLQPALYTGPVQDTYVQPAVQRSYAQPRVRRVSTVSAAPAAAPAPVYRQEVRRGRSTGKSVLIVAGSAGAGAAIGGIAGGGKGAAIGALAGGLGGLVYDRITANK